ncbi:LytTR family DNA-binding domain-containing protein [Winogradskyella bathintestinalis]|uniref:LytTR family DNA-binding domain-containing protein n=1 Tax=Winogradskyella bathintestinalis TaxID=3035208 RepID=A0ABT7ZXP9_9FLAO|nr:LytTR family DNA-binding domain-containing protein [Winogradskyella bathintestinalis]MDN3493771.1 LytTR family DNA-binding domain-containing protein [Winogradskyella bathintestinalis]
MKRLYPFDPLLKHHVVISLLLGIWIFVFLYFTEPLDVNELPNNEKLIFLPGYGLVAAFCYLLFLPFQYYLYHRFEKQWKVISELAFIITFSVVTIIISRCYYLFVVVANEPNPYSLGYMLTTIFFPALATILPIILIGRFGFGKYYEKRLEDQKVEIKGEGNYEGLRLQLNEIISIQSSDNYIEVFYLSGTNLKKTLIRNKLSVIANEFPELLRAHRSYLINPFHFQQWKTENGKLFVILNHQIEVPISKTYQKDIKMTINSATN